MVHAGIIISIGLLLGRSLVAFQLYPSAYRLPFAALCCGLNPLVLPVGTIISIGLLRTISFDWMEQCIWSEQAPGTLLPCPQGPAPKPCSHM